MHDVGRPRRGAALVRGLPSRGPSPVQLRRVPHEEREGVPGGGSSNVRTVGRGPHQRHRRLPAPSQHRRHPAGTLVTPPETPEGAFVVAETNWTL